MTISEQKQLLRAKIRKRKMQFTPDELVRKSAPIIEQLQAESSFAEAKTIMLYWSLPDEVDTHQLIQQLLPQKRIVLPTISGESIVPVALKSMSNLHEGQFHILEPKNNAYSDKIDLIIVPGVAFTTDGSRLGRGRGFYDRFLALHNTIPTIGLAFDFQIVKAIPTDSNDIKIGKVIY